MLQNLLAVSVEVSKQRYYSRLLEKVMDQSTISQTYWSVLKFFHKNIPCTPPIFDENRFATDFKEKDFKIQLFFAKQCSIIDNGRNWILYQISRLL